MKLFVSVLLAAWMTGAREPTQVPVLDFTLAPPAGGVTSIDAAPLGIVAGTPRRTTSATFPGGPALTLPFKIALKRISSGMCGQGEEIIYEVELTNTDPTPVVLPWSTLEQEVEPDRVPAGYRRLTLALMAHRPKTGPTVVGHVNIAAGSDVSPGSLRTVAPGDRVILRAPATCPSLSDVSAARQTDSGAVASIFASLMIQTQPGLGGPMARSAPVKLTVVK